IKHAQQRLESLSNDIHWLPGERLSVRTMSAFVDAVSKIGKALQEK
ncbi:hypothetical protein EVA_22492, partial [gut metagenome]